MELRVCLMQLFHFLLRVVYPVQNLLLCTKFHENRMIFHWDMGIYRFLKWRSGRPPSWNCFTTIRTKSLLLAAAACQISCQSDTQTWRYSCLNFSHIWLEMPIQFPKIGVLGDFGPLTDSSRPLKGTSLRKSASFKLSTVKICRGVWPVGELTESVMDTHTQVNLYCVHAQHWTDK